MEVPRYWRSQAWRYRLDVAIENNQVVSPCPREVRDYVENQVNQEKGESLLAVGLIKISQENYVE